MSQKEIVLNELRERGSISRNWCLNNHISRLSSIIYNLRKGGIHLSAKRGERKSDDYSYHLIK